jgi:hypothetical protein
VNDKTLPAPVQDGPSLREIVWSADTAESLDELAGKIAKDRSVAVTGHEVHAVDETGFGVGLAVSSPRLPATNYPGPNRSGNITR